MESTQRELIKKLYDVPRWNRWRRENPHEAIDLIDLHLIEADFHGIDLHHANLSFSDLRFASLDECNLEGATLNGTKLDGANLRFTSLRRARMHRTSLRRTELRGTDFYGAEIHDVDFHGADLGGAKHITLLPSNDPDGNAPSAVAVWGDRGPTIHAGLLTLIPESIMLHCGNPDYWENLKVGRMYDWIADFLVRCQVQDDGTIETPEFPRWPDRS